MPPPSPNSVRAKRHEVAVRYGSALRAREGTASVIDRKRLRDLDRLFHYRYRDLTLPDDDSGRDDLAIALDHLVLRPDAALILKRWVISRAPWLTDQELETMRNAAGRTWTATELGTHLGLTDDERTKLRITTIAPRGLTKLEWEKIRADRKRRRDRDAMRRKRKKVKEGRNVIKASRIEDILSVLPRSWISAGDISDLVTIFPGWCDLKPASRRRAVNRTINDLADANAIEIKLGPRGRRLIRDLSPNE